MASLIRNQLPKIQQVEYMKKNSKYYRIGLINGEPAGYFGVVDEDIRIYASRIFRKMVLENSCNELQKLWPESFAKIKIENNASESYLNQLVMNQFI